MIRSKILCGLTAAFTCALSSAAVASVFSARIRPIHFNPQPADYSHGLDLSTIRPVESKNVLTSADVQNVIPTDLNPNDQAGVGRQILNNTVTHALNSDSVRGSSLGRTALSLEHSMQGGISIGKGDSGSSGASREPNSVQHEFHVAADPLQAQARLNYSGLTNAQLKYTATESKMDFEWREPIAALATDVVFNHTNVPGDRREIMSLHWSW